MAPPAVVPRRYAEELLRGGLAFWACGVASQALQGLAHVSTKQLLLPSLCNVGTVGVASVLAYRWARQQDDLLRPFVTPGDVRALVCGMAIFAILGGRTNSLTPSNVAAVGAFGRKAASLKAQFTYATKAQRIEIAALGKKFGCHSCGRRFGTTFIADHQPPLKLTRWRRKVRFLPFMQARYRFYPQCASCSRLQAAAVRFKPVKVKFHFFKLRPYHLTGGLVPPATDVLAKLDSPSSSSSRRGL